MSEELDTATSRDHHDRRGFLGPFVALLRVPAGDGEQQAPPAGEQGRLLVATLVALAAYGAAAGAFQGGGQVLVAAAKAPLIVFGSLLLCLPSFFVLTTLTGVRFHRRDLIGVVVGFCGITAWLLLSLLPVAWLFSVSSRSLVFMVVVHLTAWIAATGVGRRYLVRVLPGAHRGSLAVWGLLLLFVSLQMTTQLRPVLWHEDDQPLLTQEKRSFIEQLGTVFDHDFGT